MDSRLRTFHKKVSPMKKSSSPLSSHATARGGVNLLFPALETSPDHSLLVIDQMLEALQEAVCLVDESLRVRHWNRAMSHLTGIHKEDALNSPLLSLLPCNFGKPLTEALAGLFSPSKDRGNSQHAQGCVSAGEASAHRGLEPFFIFEYRLSMLPTAGGKELALLSLREAPHKRLLRRQAACRERFTFHGKVCVSVAHEMTGALNVICSRLEEISSGKEMVEDVGSEFQDIIAQVYRMSHLTDHLVALSYQAAPAFVAVNLNELILEAIANVESTTGRSLLLDCDLEAPLPQIAGDPLMLQMMVQNLIEHAAGACGDDFSPKVATTSHAEGLRLLVQMKNNGQVLGNWRPVPSQYERKTPEQEVASGPGLFVAHRIVNEHHGSIHLNKIEGGLQEIVVALPFNGRAGRAQWEKMIEQSRAGQNH